MGCTALGGGKKVIERAYERGIMHGASVPLITDFGIEIAVCKEMHWSVGELYAAPARMVDEILTRLESERKWKAQRDKRDAERQRKKGGK